MQPLNSRRQTSINVLEKISAMGWGQGYHHAMKLWITIALLLFAAPAFAERLQFDHRLYPPLQQVLDSGDESMIDFNDINPARLVDLIAIKGKSAQSWTEALEIVAIRRPSDVETAQDWMAILQRQALSRCPATFKILAEDTTSITFERTSPNCPAERAQMGLYRLVAGKRSWFQLSILVKGDLDDLSRQQWLVLLASAQLR
ncbi:MAG: hypothetical protein RL425_1568 [Pseudomonadota bacterium]